MALLTKVKSVAGLSQRSENPEGLVVLVLCQKLRGGLEAILSSVSLYAKMHMLFK